MATAIQVFRVYSSGSGNMFLSPSTIWHFTAWAIVVDACSKCAALCVDARVFDYAIMTMSNLGTGPAVFVLLHGYEKP